MGRGDGGNDGVAFRKLDIFYFLFSLLLLVVVVIVFHVESGRRKKSLLPFCSAWKTRTLTRNSRVVEATARMSKTGKIAWRRENLYFLRACVRSRRRRTHANPPCPWSSILLSRSPRPRGRFVNTTVIDGNSDFRRVTNTFPLRPCRPAQKASADCSLFAEVVCDGFPIRRGAA